MPDNDDDVKLPRPPRPPAPSEPQVLPPMAPSFAPEWPPDLRSRPVDASDAPPDDPSSEWWGRMPHGPPPPPYLPRRSGYRFSAFAMAAILSVAVGIVAFVLLKPASPHAAPGTSVTGSEQTIELPPGQHLVSAEIGDDGQVYYRYAPAQSGAELRSSTVEGRSSKGAFLGRVRFIERAPAKR